MSVSFILRTQGLKMGTIKTAVVAHVTSTKHHLDCKVSTEQSVTISDWNRVHRDAKGKKPLEEYRKKHAEGKKVYAVLDRISARIDDMLVSSVLLTKDDIKEAIYSIVHEGEIESQKEQEKMTLHKFFTAYLNGDITKLTKKGTTLTRRTMLNTNQAFVQLKAFEAAKCGGRELDFSDMNKSFYNSFITFLSPFSQNTIAGHIKNIKAVLRCAEDMEYNSNSNYRSWGSIFVDTDNIALTKDELDAINTLDLSGMGFAYAVARDIFMMGVYTAQRVSDYNNPEKIGNIIEAVDDNGRTFRYIELEQKKTGTICTIPVSPKMDAILSKYNYRMPHIAEQTLNRHIKEIAKMAGGSLLEIETYNVVIGGKTKKVKEERYKRIGSHTARRTGATLLYLASTEKRIREDDIREITGHQSTRMLRKYIKADSIDKAKKLIKNPIFID